jgi:hypothetical protein
MDKQGEMVGSGKPNGWMLFIYIYFAYVCQGPRESLPIAKSLPLSQEAMIA